VPFVAVHLRRICACCGAHTVDHADSAWAPNREKDNTHASGYTDNLLVLPRIPRPDADRARFRPVTRVVTVHGKLEGAGVPIHRPFPGELPETESDPFLLLDHAGPIEWRPGEAREHRGIPTAVSKPWRTSSTARSSTMTRRAAAASSPMAQRSG